MNTSILKQEWFGNVRGDVLSGIVVALALIPEAIAFSIIAGVDPMVGLYASFCIAIVISFVGGRPGMISAATGAMALVMVDLVKDHGLNYLLAATILTGILQVLLGVFKIGKLMKFIPKPVMTGFVNSLAILIFTAQLTHFVGETWIMYVMTAVSLAIIYLFPRITKIIPSPLVAIIFMTIVAVTTGATVRTVGDMGQLTEALPMFMLPDIPFTFETLAIIFPYSIALAFVGLLESLLTAQIVDEMTDTDSNKNREAKGQGIANIIAGCFGGMAGCAMIGQSGINIKSGGRGRLSTFVAGAFLMVLIMILNDVLIKIPMAALVAVMIMVSIGTFDWSSLKRLGLAPKTDAAVMIVTVIIVLYTHDLSKGVFAGVLLSMIFFSAKISKVSVEKTEDIQAKKIIYRITGQLFFASVQDFVSKFDVNEKADSITIDFSHSKIWDASAVGAVDKVVLKYRLHGKSVQVLGLDHESSQLLEKLATYDSKIS
ncbi:sulfate transporter [Peribacillus butanolivorans]|uniref:SulP family inorganic anion transporter n=1 Tax=Peribacillus butanolivorans TaxID=421767 RepID=UPI0006A6ADE3|nr:SulP family inorganic anion transporter [Peribacillus butanolivorans]KON67964.1 sulfate transporter [Peribacillus butanolivorans]KRF55171.1 sulfate transporter [Bacillus sp. Soil768D1]